MYIQTSPGLGKVEALCEPAGSDLEHLADSLKWLNNALRRRPLNQRRIALLKRLVESNVDTIIRSLGGYIEAGCCEPALKSLEAQASKLPWPTDSDLQKQRGKLIDAIQKAQEKARKDFTHC